ncbi:hypothetical protein JCM10213_007555 [Rhodosporidiobolus nylandii]
MPAPPLPNELVVLIFEHLYRLLCVDQTRTFLSHPEAASLIFHHLSLVSRTWYRLALPFLGRHVNAHTYLRYDGAGFLERNGIQDEVRSIRCVPTEAGFKGQMAVVDAHAGTLERLYIVRNLRSITWGAFFPNTLGSAFPSLREFRVDFRSSGSVRILPLLQSLACRAPRVEILHITAGRERLTAAAQTHDGVARFSCLTSLAINNLRAQADFVSQVIVPLLIEPSQNSLEGLTLDISLPTWQTALPFADLVPCSFPRLVRLSCTSTRISCDDPAFFDAFPSMRSVSLSLTGQAFPPLPPILHEISVLYCPAASIASLIEQLCALSPEYLAHLRGVGLHPRNVTDEQLEELKPSVLRLASWATYNSITLRGTDVLISLCTPDEVFSTLPRLTVRSSATDELDLAPSDSEDEDEDDSGEHSEGEDETKSDDSGAYDEEYEDDWDAEDEPLFRERWSKEKRLRYELENAFPHLASDFPSGEAFRAAKQAAVEAMRPFLRV